MFTNRINTCLRVNSGFALAIAKPPYTRYFSSTVTNRNTAFASALTNHNPSFVRFFSTTGRNHAKTRPLKDMRNYYQMLEVKDNATPAELKKAY
eukprot:Awhi_evm1s1605